VLELVVALAFELEQAEAVAEGIVQQRETAVGMPTRRCLENGTGSKGMGTTCTALAIAGHTAHLVHVGDSRAYLLRGATITRLTRDMSVWAERVRDGVMPSSEYGRNQLAAALGLDAVLTPQTRTVDVASGDRFLLCSDGLWGLVTDPELLQIARAAALEAACRKLIDLANRRGGPDNVSVVLASVDG